ncbi:aromatic ring-hydroxylating oxygenase subunit alpha [Novosphingobium sp. 9]|uniref:aromatic ring-hydroxylating oxygenase subunit alpha n=1 Tax=Novosphingobium sp. 9 TaxID=2025349 RepID=UPI0021B64996|nr:aromatic ring-hydroxylating dioxygenase subunit alpha [Novosphingobium sp. 9]
MTVLTRDFFDSFASSVRETEVAESLPPACYTSQEFFGFEKEAIFMREWLCVGREDWVPNTGDYYTFSHSGEPIIIARAQDGSLNAMSAVCQHRAMLVAEGRGNARGFLCPYHHWSYALDGRLVAAPAMSKTCNFDKAQNSLPKLKLESWHGFLFVNFDPDAEPLAPRLACLEPVMANYAVADLKGPQPGEPTVYPWNWKVMFENNNDGYHANRLHHGPLHDIVPSSLASFPELPEGTAGYYRLNGSTHPHASFNPTLKALFEVFPDLTEEERNRVLFVNLPPSLSMVVMNDMVLYLILDARAADSHGLTMGTLVTAGAMQDELYDLKMKMNEEAVTEIVGQDLHVDLMVQAGLNSRFAPRGRYSWQEGAQRQFNLWLVDRYEAGRAQLAQ